MIRALVTRMRIGSLVRVAREIRLDFLLATVNPMAPHLHELLIARANLARPMQPRRTR